MRCNPVWSYFNKLEDDRSKAMCKYCGKKYSLGSEQPKLQTTSGLKNHLRTRHGDIYLVFMKRLADRKAERSAKQLVRPSSPRMHFPVVSPIPAVVETTMESMQKLVKDEIQGMDFPESPTVTDEMEHCVNHASESLREARYCNGVNYRKMKGNMHRNPVAVMEPAMEPMRKFLKQEIPDMDFPETSEELQHTVKHAVELPQEARYCNGVNYGEVTGGQAEVLEEESTSGASTADSAHRAGGVLMPTPRSDGSVHRQLSGRLRDLEEENKKLLEKLIDSQLAFQDVLKHAIDSNQQHTDLLRRSVNHWESPRRGSLVPVVHFYNDADNTELTDWLSSIGVDRDVADKLNEEEFTKNQLLNSATRDDLYRLGLKGGVCCRIWEAISAHRRRSTSSAVAASATAASTSEPASESPASK